MLTKAVSQGTAYFYQIDFVLVPRSPRLFLKQQYRFLLPAHIHIQVNERQIYPTKMKRTFGYFIWDNIE